MKRYRTGWISDIHLGSRGSKAEALLQFLREYEFEKLYIVGDFIDVWQLKRGIYWPQAHNDVIQKILRAGRKGTRVIYIPGNHDEFVAGFFGHFGAVEIMARDIHTTADGRRLLIIHGHELDTVVQNIKWLAFVGDEGEPLDVLHHGVQLVAVDDEQPAPVGGCVDVARHDFHRAEVTEETGDELVVVA